jgi:iron complex outermembrane recepter protein
MSYVKSYQHTMKRPLFFLIFNIYLISLYSQTPGAMRAKLPPLAKDSARIMMRVTEGNDEKAGIAFATGILMRAKDSSIVRTSSTGNFGGLIFNNIPFGSYIVKIVMIGYKPYFTNSVTVSADQQEARIPRAGLEKDNKVLKTVDVVADKTDFQNGLDKKVYNVDKNITNAGGTATDILQNIPSVNVDMDGKVSLRGSEQVRIMIDGKLSGMMANNAQAALQQMPASMIEQIEIIANPGAKYDAEGMGGIINIITKKGGTTGWNLNGQLSAGTNDKYTAGLGGNYRSGKINFSANYNYRSENRWMRAKSKQIAKDASALNFTSKLDGANQNRVHNIRLGNDFFLDKYNTVSLGFSYNKRENTSRDYTDYIQSTAFSSIDSVFYINNKSIDDNSNLDFTIDYKYADVEAKKNFSISLNQSNGSRASDTRSFNQLSESLNQSYFRSNLVDGNVFLTTAQMDYNQNLWNGKLDAGLKFTQRFAKALQGGNLLNFATQDYFPDPSQKNDYDYNEQVPAAFLQYGKSFSKWETQFGLRYEHTLVNINNRTYDSLVQNNYGYFFPSGFLKYKIKEGTDAQLSYSRRINRPGIEALNPIVDNSNPLNLRVGNPYLKPELIHSLDLSYSTLVKIISISASVYYRRSENIQSFFRTLDPNNSQVTITQSRNFSSSDNIGTEFTIRTFLGKQGNIMWNVNGFFNKINASNIEGALQSSGYNWNTRLIGNYRFKTNTSAQLSAFYMSPVIRPQGTFQGMNGVDIGVRQELMKGKFNVSLNVTDIFDIREFRITNTTNLLAFEANRKRESRIATLTLQWKIGSLEDKEEKRRMRRGQGDNAAPNEMNEAAF